MPAAREEYGNLPFAEQIAFFRQKINVPTAAWTDVYGAEHDQAFMVAGAMKADLLADLRGAVDKAISEGGGFAAFKRDFKEIVARTGWSFNGGANWRAGVIYQTNLYQSYSAGREAQMADPALRRRRPYGLYRHSGAENPRPEHLAHDGKVVPLDDPWWDVWTPQNGWGCKCKKFMVSDADVERMGLKVEKGPPIQYEERTIGQRSGNPRTVRVPKGIDPGFEYRPGATRLGKAAELFIAKSATLPADVAALAVAPLTVRTRILSQLKAEFSAWLLRAQSQPTRNLFFHAGVIRPELLEELSKRGIKPESAAVLVRDREVQHALRGFKQELRTSTKLAKAVAPSDLARLPEVLVQPRAVLLDRRGPTLLYVFDPAPGTGRSAAKAVVQVDFRGPFAARPGEQSKVTTNAFKTATLLETSDLKAQLEAGQVELLEGKL